MFTVAALYHFTPLKDLPQLQASLKEVCSGLDIKGTLLVAHEGINGTVAGSETAIHQTLDFLTSLPEFKDLSWKVSYSPENPFRRLKIRLKKEIVTMGQSDVDPLASVGRYVDAGDWNELISQDDVVVIDTRNDYEVAIGSFEGAINPKTKSFRDFPAWWEENKSQFSGKKIAMFCTGGIRCEKSTSYLVGLGEPEVYHLKDGILKYLEVTDREDTKWQGECFVFDDRVSVGHGLEIGSHQLCHGCRQPILPEDMKRTEYEAGVSCHKCFDQTSDSDKARFRERQRQLGLAHARSLDISGG